MPQYQIIKQLGSGSFGKVFKAIKKDEPNKFIAIKQIKMTALTEKQKDCAMNEIRLLASIECANVVTYHTAFFDGFNNNLCIVMEFADGGDLQGLIKKKKESGLAFHQNYIWKVAFDLLRALKVLHNHKILHRDIKPGNVFIADGLAKLGDLNLSKVMEGNFACTQAGTPFYTSPQIWNGQFYDGKCDIWSLGCLLYQMTCFKPPFMANSFPQLRKKVSQGFYDPIPSIYSKRLGDLIKNCLKVSMYERSSSIELLNDPVFQYMKTSQEGTVNLLNTIRCPKILSLIQQKLPQMKSVDKNLKSQYKKDPIVNKQCSSKSVKGTSQRQILIQPSNSHKQNENQRVYVVNRPESTSFNSRVVVHRLQSPQTHRVHLEQQTKAKSPTIYRRLL